MLEKVFLLCLDLAYLACGGEVIVSLKWSLALSVWIYCLTWFQGTDPLSFCSTLLCLATSYYLVVPEIDFVFCSFLTEITFFHGCFSDCLFSLPCWCNLPYKSLSLLLQLASQWTPWQLALSPTAVSYLPAAFYHFACILVITNRLLRLLFGALVIPCWFYHLFPTDLFLNLCFVLYPILILDV